jgi:hypothetical protein
MVAVRFFIKGGKGRGLIQRRAKARLFFQATLGHSDQIGLKADFFGPPFL